MKALAVSTWLIGMAIMTTAHAEPPRAAMGWTQGTAQTNPVLATPNPSALGTERARRARANLEALLQGRIAVNDLSPQEYQDVLAFDRALRSGTTDNRSFDQQCIDREVSRNGGEPTRLAWEVIKLKCR